MPTTRSGSQKRQRTDSITDIREISQASQVNSLSNHNTSPPLPPQDYYIISDSEISQSQLTSPAQNHNSVLLPSHSEEYNSDISQSDIDSPNQNDNLSNSNAVNQEFNDSDDQTSGISDDEDKDFYPSESESDHDIPDFITNDISQDTGNNAEDDVGNDEANVNFGRIDVRASEILQSVEWKCDPNSVSFQPLPNFTGIESKEDGVQNVPENAKTPLGFWSLLITLEMIREIVNWTNDYAAKWKIASPNQIYDVNNPQKNMFPKKPKWLAKWKSVNEIEIRCFIAIQYIMSFVKISNLKSYWDSSKKYFNFFGTQDIMSRFRFFQIKTCFHLTETQNGSNTVVADKLIKIRSFFEKFLRNCQRFYRPHEILSLDEMMVRFSGRVEFKFTQQPKPTPNGFKLIGLVDAKTAYTYSAVIDTREKDLAKYHYVLQLVDDLKDDYHTLVMDRGYSTLDLFGTLMKRKIYAVGTIKKYKNLPSLIRNAKPFRMSRSKALRKKSGNEVEEADESDSASVASAESEEQTESEFEDNIISIDAVSAPSAILKPAASDDVGLKKGQWLWMVKKLDSPHHLLSIAWHDSGICLALSTKHTNAGSVVERKVKGSSDPVLRTCPELIEFYNKYMGGVDRADSLRAHLTTIRRCKKWWHALWHFILDTAFINSTILSNESGFKIQDRAAHLHDLIRELIGDSQTAFQKRRPRIQFDPPLPHYSAETPNPTTQRGACKVCYANSFLDSSRMHERLSF
jgi:hypothetical protein